MIPMGDGNSTQGISYRRDVERMTLVRCTVNACSYWAENDVCSADAITVRNNPKTAKRREHGDEVSMEFGEIGREPLRAETSVETYCHTMRKN